MQCSQCNHDIADEEIDLCRVTEQEAREYRDVRVGQLVCVVCWHAIKWPSLTRPAEGDEDLDWTIDRRDDGIWLL
jgi:hypothetical protein